MRRFAQRVLLVLIGLLIALSTVEVGLRGILGRRVDYDRAYRQYDPLVGHVHPPHLDLTIPFEEHPQGYFALRTEAGGLREDEDVPQEKPPGVFRILVLGDSHTDGTVFNAETYPNALERLHLEQGGTVEVLNAGVSDYDPLQELLWLHSYGRAYQPDTVVLGLYVGNDLLEMQGFDSISLAGNDLWIDGKVHQAVPQPVGDRVEEFLNGFYTYGFIRWSLFPTMVGETDPGGHNRAFRTCRGCYWQSLNQAARFTLGELDMDRSFDRMRVVLAALEAASKSMGSEFVVLLIPTRRQVEGDAADRSRYLETAEALGLNANALEFDDRVYQQTLEVVLAEDLPVIDPLEGMQEAFLQSEQQLYYSTDWHLNPDGHRILAEILAEALAPGLP